MKKLKKLVAVLSTTILPLDGVYSVREVNDISEMSITGAPHYIGHPTTKEIVENLGAVPAASKLFPGLNPGESAVCFAIKQGRSSRRELGKTVDQDVCMDDLQVRIITRIDDGPCPFCGSTTLVGQWICPGCGAS